jgi:hypothetical protein
MRFHITKKIFILVLLFLYCSCNQEKNPVVLSPNPVIDSVAIPTKWNTRSEIVYKVEVRVLDAQGFADIDSVNLKIFDPNTTSLIFNDNLYDDAAYYHAQDGDVVAGDGIYSNRFLATRIVPAQTSGEYTFEFTASDKQGNHSQIEKRSVLFAPNYSPVINSVTVPDTLSITPGGLVIRISVSDYDGIADVIRAYFESQSQQSGARVYESEMFNDGNYEIHGDLTAGDSVFSVRLDTSFFVGKQGNYKLLFYVQDSFFEQNEVVPEHEIFVGNTPPQIVDIILPETITRPTSSGTYKRALLTVQVRDAQGLADIDSVYFYSRKPDSTMANEGKRIPLVDNGLPFDPLHPDIYTGDLQAGDGIYSLSLLVYSDYQLGTYTFTFYVLDKAGNLSAPVVRTLEITD